MSEYLLYDYPKSSAAYRVRIALHWKGIPFQSKTVHLLKDGGDQHQPSYQALNPAELVPVLKTPTGDTLHQSLAIIEYLDTLHPTPALLPSDPVERAQVVACALDIAADVHPLNNLRVLQYLKETLNVTDNQKRAWYAEWIHRGLAALESRAGKQALIGEKVSVADLCLVPQLYNAKRFEVEVSAYPKLCALAERLNEHPAFQAARPKD